MKFWKRVCAAVIAASQFIMSIASLTVSAVLSKSEPPYTAYLCISAGADQQWEEGDLEGESATITGDGDYCASVTILNSSDTIELLWLDTNINAYAFVAEGGDPLTEGTAKISVNSIQVEHVSGTTDDIAFTETSSCLRMSDNGSSLRFAILDQWSVTKVACINSEVPGGLEPGDKIVVYFAVSGINSYGGSNSATDSAPSPIHEIQWKDWWYHIIDDSSIEITGYTGDENVIEIPSKIDGYTVKGIGDSAFYKYGYESYFYSKKIIIPDNVGYIGNYAFSRCRLSEISIPDSITQIGEAAFLGCNYLTSISIQGEISEIKDNTFSNCTSLESVSLPDSVLQISNNAFKKCESLLSINLPSKLKIIGDYAFSGCTKLNAIDIPNSTTSLGNYAFSNCTELVSVNLSDNLNQIGKAAFTDCENILAVNLPNGITKLEGDSFYNCVNLQAIYIPNSILNICDSAFRYCDALNNVYYNGTENMWNAITIETNNRCLLNANIHYNYQEIDTSSITTTTITTNSTNIPTTSNGTTTTSTTSTTSTNSGDIDNNTAIDANDAYLCLLAYARISVGSDTGLTDAQTKAADVDGNGSITPDDAYYILLYYAKQSVGQDVTWEELL
ncbi:MAG: leucine-rich repeat protein [Ruminococcus sp.]